MLMRRFLRHLYCAARYGEWSCGWEWWPDKPRIGVFFDYYDGWHWCLHLGPLWIECDY
jgi:hypothetical protein